MKMPLKKHNIKQNTNRNNKILIITAMLTALLCIMSQISIPTPFVPFSLSLLAVFIVGAILPPRYALMCTIAYIILGIFGLPVFAGMRGGLGVLFDKTGGYLIAYPLMSCITALFHTSNIKNKTLALSIGMLISLALCYLSGTAWFSLVTGITFYKSLALCVAPYIIFDILKIALSINFYIIISKSNYLRLL